MSAVRSSLSQDQQIQLTSLFTRVRLHLLHKASVHGFTAAAFHSHCDKQGPTVIVAYNAAGYIFGAYTSRDYTQNGEAVSDERAFLYSISPGRVRPLRVAGITGQQTFMDGPTGPDFGALVFLADDQPAVKSNPGTQFHFQAAEMHGNDLKVTELEVYRVENLGDFLEKPWRNMEWTPQKKEQLLSDIQNYKPDIKNMTQARVLLVGPVGAGKSSFFNSINSAFRGNMTCQAMTGIAGSSLTTQYRAYNIKVSKRGGAIPLILCDTMGLEEAADKGLNLDDVISIFKGHIKDRYQFSTVSGILEDAPGYKKEVTLNDKIHCVAYVVEASKVSLLTKTILDKIQAIRKKANQLGIPQILLMTKVDEACPLVEKDLKNVYHSAYIQQKARQLSESLGIPLSYVLPVKNYCEELEPDLNTDILLFKALDQMLNFADSFFENQVQDDGDDEPELYRSNKNHHKTAGFEDSKIV